MATAIVDQDGNVWQITPDGKGLVTLDGTPVTVSGEMEIKNDTGNPVPVNGTVALDAATLAALEQVTVAIASGQIVGLDAATLAALEAITVSGTVALDAATLAALESVTVAGTVALDSATLAALESITATISGTVAVAGTVALDGPTLAALETIQVGNFPATQPVSGPLTDAQLRAAAVPVSGPLTDAQLRAAAVGISAASLPLPTGAATDASLGTDGATPPVIAGTGVRGWLRAIYDRLVAGIGRTWTLGSGTDSVTIVPSGTQAVSGPLTDTQLRATAVPVSGPLTDTQIRATPLPVSGTVSVGNFPASTEIANDVGNPVPVSGTVTATGPLTDTQLRAAPVVVSGPLTDTQLRAAAVGVSGPLTDAQLRATAVPVVSSGATASAPATLSIAATAAAVLAANANRKSVLIQNTSAAATVYVGYGSNPTAASGIRLQPGESLYEDRFTGAIHALASVAVSVPYVEVT